MKPPIRHQFEIISREVGSFPLGEGMPKVKTRTNYVHDQPPEMKIVLTVAHDLGRNALNSVPLYLAMGIAGVNVYRSLAFFIGSQPVLRLGRRTMVSDLAPIIHS